VDPVGQSSVTNVFPIEKRETFTTSSPILNPHGPYIYCCHDIRLGVVLKHREKYARLGRGEHAAPRYLTSDDGTGRWVCRWDILVHRCAAMMARLAFSHLAHSGQPTCLRYTPRRIVRSYPANHFLVPSVIRHVSWAVGMTATRALYWSAAIYSCCQ
jgi:hypothetical protein